VETSDHFDGTRFLNPTGAHAQPLSALPRLLRTPRTPWPARIALQPRRPPALESARAIVTFIGHSTFLIQTPFGNVLTDPVYALRAGPFNVFGPRRVRQPAVLFDDLPPVAAVLLSHNHYDHCDVRTLGLLAGRFDPVVVTPLRNAALVRSSGVRRVHELDWWEDVKAGSLHVSLTPAQHFSARGPFDRNRGLWGGFMLVAGDVRVYFAGDTGAGPFFREIRQRLGSIDLALLPIGAYEPRWFMKDVHMNPAEAVQAHLDLEAAQSISMHFGTFQLTTEGIDEPLRALEEACRTRNVPPQRFRTLEFGESFRLG
jgi:L-ascorbate metabolism protein UlaG (beta-lactamase superfamily)